VVAAGLGAALASPLAGAGALAQAETNIIKTETTAIETDLKRPISFSS
jgi:hypothetical protein